MSFLSTKAILLGLAIGAVLGGIAGFVYVAVTDKAESAGNEPFRYTNGELFQVRMGNLYGFADFYERETQTLPEINEFRTVLTNEYGIDDLEWADPWGNEIKVAQGNPDEIEFYFRAEVSDDASLTKQELTKVRINNLVAYADRYRNTRGGNLPGAGTNGGARKTLDRAFNLTSADWTDGWGNPISASDERPLRFVSAGEDGRKETSDDVDARLR